MQKGKSFFKRPGTGEEIVYDPTTCNSPESFVYNKTVELWNEPGAAAKYARLFVERVHNVKRTDTRGYKVVLKAARALSKNEYTYKELRNEFAQQEILYQAVQAMLKKIRSEMAVTTSLAFGSQNIGEAMEKVKGLSKKRDGYVLELDISTHTEDFPNPF